MNVLFFYKACPECGSHELTLQTAVIGDKEVTAIFCVDCGIGAPIEMWNKIERKEVMPPKKEVPIDVEEEEVEVTESEETGEALNTSDIEM